MNIPASASNHPFALIPIHIPEGVVGLEPTGIADVGIPHFIYDKRPEGLLCVIDPLTDLREGAGVMEAFDEVTLYVDDVLAPNASHTILPGKERERFGIYLIHGLLKEGVNKLHYRVTRVSGNANDSNPMKVLYHLRAPGAPAPLNMDLVIPPDVITNGVDADRAALGVAFGFTYSNRRAYDRIDFVMGNFTDPFEVPNDLLPVTRTLGTVEFTQAGDNPNTELVFTVWDQLNNFTRSSPKYLDVHLNQEEPPAPTVIEAVGTLINLNDVRNGATVQIPIEARLGVGDTGVVRWVGVTGSGSDAVPFTVGTAGELPKKVPVPYSVVAANLNKSITLDYTLQRLGSNFPVPSKPAVYDIQQQANAGLLLVMGARGTSNSLHWTGVGASCLLWALDKSRLIPLEASWQYEGESAEAFRGAYFRDTQPWRVLRVWTPNDEVRINPANLFGAGNFEIAKPNYPWGAFVARRDDGQLRAWGVPKHGGVIPPLIESQSFVSVAHAAYAFAARRADGRVAAWGWEERGGIVPVEIARLRTIVKVVGAGHAFAALLSSGQVVAWGDEANGGKIPAQIATYNDVVEVVATAHAFAARRSDGTVVGWGNPEYAAAVPADLRNIDKLSNSYWAFVARRANGGVVAWATRPNSGGEIPAMIASRSDIVEIVGAQYALAARCEDGSVVAWGDPTMGGTVPKSLSEPSNVVQIVSTAGAFAALHADGDVLTWGHEEFGFTHHLIPDVVQIAATSAAFAALRRDGTVVAWGHQGWGGLVPVTGLTKVRAIYANSQAFAALTDDGRVVTWGLPDAGGNSQDVEHELRGQMSYYATPASRGAVLDLQSHRNDANAVEGATITPSN
jgi:hypothetical protein